MKRVPILASVYSVRIINWSRWESIQGCSLDYHGSDVGLFFLRPFGRFVVVSEFDG